MDIIEKARAYAADKHADKKRKYTDQPYFNHLQAVVSTLQGAGVMEPPILAAAYLHDTVEDTDATIQDIIVEFGADVAELVYWLTDAEEGNRESRTLMSSWRVARADAGENSSSSPTSSTTLPASANTTASSSRFGPQKSSPSSRAC